MEDRQGYKEGNKGNTRWNIVDDGGSDEQQDTTRTDGFKLGNNEVGEEKYKEEEVSMRAVGREGNKQIRRYGRKLGKRKVNVERSKG